MVSSRISKTTHILAFILCVTLLAGCEKKPATAIQPTVTIDVPTSTPEEPTPTSVPLAATVNGEGITVDEFNQEKQRFQDGLTKAGIALPDEKEQNQRVIDELTDQVLLKQGAVESGYSPTADEIKARMDKLVQDLGGMEKLSAWEQTNFYTDAVFQKAFERSIYATWMRDKIVREVPNVAEQVHIRQIRVLSEAEAQGILAQLNAGSDFATLAQQYDPVTKGDLGWFPRGYLTQPAVEDVAFSLAVDAVSQVIKTDIGFHIIQVIEKDSQHQLTPDALKTVQQQGLKRWLDDRRSKSTIVINV